MNNPLNNPVGFFGSNVTDTYVKSGIHRSRVGSGRKEGTGGEEMTHFNRNSGGQERMLFGEVALTAFGAFA